MKWQQGVALVALLCLVPGCSMTRRLDTMINQMGCMNQGLNGMRAELSEMRQSMARMDGYTEKMEVNTRKMAEAFEEEDE